MWGWAYLGGHGVVEDHKGLVPHLLLMVMVMDLVMAIVRVILKVTAFIQVVVVMRMVLLSPILYHQPLDLEADRLKVVGSRGTSPRK